MRTWLSRLLAIGLVLALGLYTLGAGQVGAAAAGRTTCYSWDFWNTTGSDADGLVIHLKGIPAISDVHTGVLNPFGAPDPSSGYNPATDVYSLVFGGGSVPDSGMAQIGICAIVPALRLDTAQPAFYRLASGAPLSPAPLFVGLDFSWMDSNHLLVHLYNEQASPLAVLSLAALTPPGPLTLDDLNDGVASTLITAGDLISDPLALDGGTSAAFDIYLNQGSVQLAFAVPSCSRLS